MPNLKENQLIFEAYRSINEIYEDRYELKTTRDGYIIIDHDIRGPNKTIARFDRDQRTDAIARYNHYTKQLSSDEIRAGFDDLRAGLGEAFANHSWSEDIIAQTVEEIKTSGYKPVNYWLGTTAWITPDGKWLNLQGEPHYMVSPTVADRGYGPAMAAGYTRVASDGEVMYVEFFGPLTRSIKRAVTDAAIEHRLGLDNIQYDPNAEKWYGKDDSEAIKESDDSDKITPATYELAKAIWPPSAFSSKEEWEAYVRKWWPKLDSMNRILDRGKIKQEANRGFSANKDEWEELSASEIKANEIKANKDVRADIYDMITKSYERLGGHPDFPSIDRVPGDNDISSVIDTDEPDDADATILSKGTEFGRKITTLATDNGNRARREVLAHIVGLLNTPGNYVEASGKLLEILINKGVPTVNNAEDVQRILKGKKIEWHTDGSYSRDIGGTTYVKRMLGKPYV